MSKIKILRSFSLTIVLALAGAIGLALTSHKTFAATSESCFNYTTADSKVTITDYYDNEGNNSANSACPEM